MSFSSTQTETLDKKDIETSRSESKEIKSTLQGSEKNQYRAQLMGYLTEVTQLGEQLAQLRADLKRQGGEYQNLLDIKTKLEMEITK